MIINSANASRCVHLRFYNSLGLLSTYPPQLPRYQLSAIRNFTTTNSRMAKYSYSDKTFRSASNTSNGEVSSLTLFHYHQDGKIVWADYSGGSITKGFLIATVQSDDSLDARYEHVNVQGELMTGKCRSTPELLEDGRVRLHEKWQWTSGDCSEGESVVEEVKE